uniref:Uncharacterized protein n=1 Tax=Glossina brevipalpis TaxID=37001 RepID=A0A1A9WZA3_9MUSC
MSVIIHAIYKKIHTPVVTRRPAITEAAISIVVVVVLVVVVVVVVVVDDDDDVDDGADVVVTLLIFMLVAVAMVVELVEFTSPFCPCFLLSLYIILELFTSVPNTSEANFFYVFLLVLIGTMQFITPTHYTKIHDANRGNVRNWVKMENCNLLHLSTGSFTPGCILYFRKKWGLLVKSTRRQADPIKATTIKI